MDLFVIVFLGHQVTHMNYVITKLEVEKNSELQVHESMYISV